MPVYVQITPDVVMALEVMMSLARSGQWGDRGEFLVMGANLREAPKTETGTRGPLTLPQLPLDMAE